MKDLIRKFETELNMIKPKTAENKRSIDSIIHIMNEKHRTAIDRQKKGGFISIEDMNLISNVLEQIKTDMVKHVHVLDQASLYSDKILASGELDKYRQAWRENQKRKISEYKE